MAAQRVVGTFGRAKSQAAKVEMATLKSALQLYYIDVGRYPTEAEGLGALLVARRGRRTGRGRTWRMRTGSWILGAGGICIGFRVTRTPST